MFSFINSGNNQLFFEFCPPSFFVFLSFGILISHVRRSHTSILSFPLLCLPRQGVSNLQSMGHMGPRIAMNVA